MQIGITAQCQNATTKMGKLKRKKKCWQDNGATLQMEAFVGTTTSENCLVVSATAEYIHILCPSSCFLPHRNL